MVTAKWTFFPGKSDGTLATGSLEARGLSAVPALLACELAATLAMIEAVELSTRRFGVKTSSRAFREGESMAVGGSEVTELGAVDEELGTLLIAERDSEATVATSVSVGDVPRLPDIFFLLCLHEG